jgi:hypothetical protein
MKTSIVFIFVLFASFSALAAPNPVDVDVNGNQVYAEINVLDHYHVTLKITFENAIGLDANTLTITAIQVNPKDLSLISRLPGNLVSLPSALPILINVTPSSQSSLTFTGDYEIELYTHDLVFDPSLRLFKSPNGGSFSDITTFSGIGSYRVRGTSGDFSDFLILLDLRSQNQVIQNKFDVLQQTLSANASRIQIAMYQNLQTELTAARNSWQQGNNGVAVSHLEQIISSIKSDNGQSMPYASRANDPNSSNVGGILRAQSYTLIFSLNL